MSRSQKGAPADRTPFRLRNSYADQSFVVSLVLLSVLLLALFLSALALFSAALLTASALFSPSFFTAAASFAALRLNVLGLILRIRGDVVGDILGIGGRCCRPQCLCGFCLQAVRAARPTATASAVEVFMMLSPLLFRNRRESAWTG